MTRPPSNTTSPSVPSIFFATGTRRSLIVSHAFFTASPFELVPNAGDAAVLDLLAVVRLVAVFVEVPLSHRLGRQIERARDAIDRVLDDDHALRSAETAERGVRDAVRLRDATFDVDVGN